MQIFDKDKGRSGLVGARQRIRRALFANLFARVVRVAEQLVLVPLLLSSWGATSYGEWLALGSIAGFAAIANLGIGHAAAAEIILISARGEFAKASSTIITSLALIFCERHSRRLRAWGHP